jgi:serpin B
MKRKIALALILILALTLIACGSEEAFTSQQLETANPTERIQFVIDMEDYFTDEFISAANFSVELFQNSYLESKSENTLISPLSVLLALSMTAHGAGGLTLEEIEVVLGGEANIEWFSTFLFYYTKNLQQTENSRLGIANSIWLRDCESFTVEEDFLFMNYVNYNADVYKSAFDQSTIRDINNWVSRNTDGLIESIINEIPPEAIMYLINAIIFDAEWQRIYYAHQVRDRDFTAYNGETQTARMMYSGEGLYIHDELATGFIKPYAGRHYSFAALLPNEGVSIDDYIASLTGESLMQMLENAERDIVSAGLPKFSFDYEITMNSVLQAMGIEAAFCEDNADFLNLGSSSFGNIFISQVLHKTYIEVDERGTKAGAVTEVAMEGEGSEAEYEPKIVILDRPFVFMIIDGRFNLPIFIGVVNSM